jgi:uncharacterized protein YjbI with pentapeptide repeats
VAKPDVGRNLPRLDPELENAVTQLDDPVDASESVVSGDFSGCELLEPIFRECRFEGVQFTGARLQFARFLDCVFADSDLSGLILEECALTRVEFRSCRASGMQAASGRFVDVGIIGSKMDGASFRMSKWERGEIIDSDLTEGDFYAAKMPNSRITGCDLARAELSRTHLAGTRLRTSNLDGVRVGDSFREITIGTDDLIPVALALFKVLRISISDEA